MSGVGHLTSVEKFMAEEGEAVELRRRIGQLERQLQKAKAQESNIIEAVVESLVEHPPKLVAPRAPSAGTGKLEEIAVLHFSDIQLGKVTETYDSAKAEERVMLAVEKAIEIAGVRSCPSAVYELLYKVPGPNLFVGGRAPWGDRSVHGFQVL